MLHLALHLELSQVAALEALGIVAIPLGCIQKVGGVCEFISVSGQRLTDSKQQVTPLHSNLPTANNATSI